MNIRINLRVLCISILVFAYCSKLVFIVSHEVFQNNINKIPHK